MDYDFLMPEEQVIMVGPANKRQAGGLASKGGHLYLTNKRLVFKAHTFNLGSAFDEIPFSKIAFSGNTLNMLMPTPNMIRVITTDGKNHGFIVTGKQKEQWKQKITEVVQSYKNSSKNEEQTIQTNNEETCAAPSSEADCQTETPRKDTTGTNYQQTINNAAQNTATVNNTMVWIIALVPVIGALFSFGFLAFLIVNIVLCTVDENNLKKAGYDTSVLGNAWLIPVYLYKRAEMFHHSKAYFIVWCVTFVISCL